MKRIYILSILALFVCAIVSAQEADIRKAAERYKNVNTLTATVIKTKHNVAVAQDIITTGNFSFNKPSDFSMIFNDTNEMLFTDGKTFTMVENGKKQVAQSKGKSNNPFEIFFAVFRDILSEEEKDTELSKQVDVKLEKQGNICTVTVIPLVDGKAKRRMMYTSFVVTIDLEAAELKSLRIHEKGENYTQFDFSNYIL